MGEILKPSHLPLLDKTCVICLVSASVFISAALILGIADNPPGAMLLFASVFAFVLAMVHRWRTPRPFMKMMLISLGAFPVMAVLHNVLEVLAGKSPGWLEPMVTTLSLTSFLLAVLVLPVTFFSGIIGIGLTKFTTRP